MRAPNEIDFWRGLALISIFINHIPGFYFEHFTHRNFGQSDSAELFVFLAGWALRLVVSSRTDPLNSTRLVLRLGARALTIYIAQILITMIAIALIAGAVLAFDNPLFLEWNNAAAVFQDPVPTHLGIMLLTHQLGFFNILPLYVVLMLAAPLIAILHRAIVHVLLPLSFCIYLAVLVLELNIPTWPVEGYWYFDPLAWQFVFILGFVLAKDDGPGAFARRHIRPLRFVGIIAVVVGLGLALIEFEPDPTWVPDPKLFFVFDKTFATPARLLHFMALSVTFGGSFFYVLRLVHPLGRFLSMLGRNSLNVFCAGSVLSLCGSIARFILGGSIVVDVDNTAFWSCLPGSDRMVVRVARTAEGTMNRGWYGVPRCASVLLVGMHFALVGTALRADEQPFTPPALSASCQAPAGDIATPEPLPHLAAAFVSKKSVRVLAIGSSSTVGVGASSARKGYPAQLELILEKIFRGVDVVIINRGVSGELAATTTQRLKLEVALERPDLVLWQLGTNDALARVPVEDFVETVKDMLQWLKQHQIDVVLVGLQYTPRAAKDEYYTAIRKALRALAAAENVLLVRRFEAMQFIEQATQADLLSSDDFHLNDLGYRCMAEHIVRAIVVSAFLLGKSR